MFPNTSKLKQNTQPWGGQNNQIPVPGITGDRCPVQPDLTRPPGPRGQGHAQVTASPAGWAHSGPLAPLDPVLLSRNVTVATQTWHTAASQEGLGLGPRRWRWSEKAARKWPHPVGVGQTKGVGATARAGLQRAAQPGKGLAGHGEFETGSGRGDMLGCGRHALPSNCPAKA